MSSSSDIEWTGSPGRGNGVYKESSISRKVVFLYGWSMSAGGGMTGEEVGWAVLKDLVGHEEFVLFPVAQEAVRAFKQSCGMRVVKQSTCI